MTDAGPPPTDAVARDLDRLRQSADAASPDGGPSRAQIDAIARWLSDPVCAADREGLSKLVQDAAQGHAAAIAELADAFAGTLPIGTGGRRGCVV